MANTPAASADLALDTTAVDLGRNMFRSFLLAGERYLQAGMQRPDTDEARFHSFYEALPAPVQEPLKGYFKRQAGLDLSQRAQLLGTLTNLTIETPLRLHRTATELVATPNFRHLITELGRMRQLNPQPIPPATRSRSAATTDFNVLRLYLNKLTVEEAQDDYRIWYPFVGWKTYNTTDEVSLGLIWVDETGEVSHKAVTIADINEGNSKTYPGDGLELNLFNLHEGALFPKFYSIMVAAVERDNGSYNQVLAKAAQYVKDKVNKELLGRGIVQVGAYFGVSIPPEVANYIANIVKSFFDSLINWLKGLLSNDDDVLGTKTATATIHGLQGGWSTGGLKAPPFDWVYAGEGGRWRTTMHWQLAKS